MTMQQPITYAPSRPSIETSFADRFIPALSVALLGLVMLYGVGFAMGSDDVIHNATHDVRHSASFPCH
jgi:cobalt transporter subunit CbtB